MANAAIPKLREYLRAHESDIAHGINDFADLRGVFRHLEGREASEGREAVASDDAESPIA